VAKIRFALARAEDAAAVAAFNDRLARAGGTSSLSLEPPFPDYRFQAASPVIVERHFAWVDDQLRGGVIIKRLPFWIASQGVREVAFYKYPVSEGIVNPEFGFLGLMIQKFVTRQYPLTYGLGTGSLASPVAQLMTGTGWHAEPVPFRFLVFRAGRFLRQLTYVRRKHAALAWGMSLMAGLGMGHVLLAGVRAVQWLSGRRRHTGGLRAETVTSWGPWADAVWQRTRTAHTLMGDRSVATLATLYPDDHPHLRRWRIRDERGEDAGWVVLSVADVHDHSHFGNARLGTLVDCLAVTGQELGTVSLALQIMQRAGADLAVLNHSAPAFVAACHRAGMLPAPTNCFLFLSPALQKALGTAAGGNRSCFFTRGDGDGPIHLS
jgi:hypothetical protein